MAKRTVTAVIALQAAAAVVAGVAHAAPGQPGLAAPEQGQPGLSTAPQPPAAVPIPVDYLPPVESLPTPSRPRPRAQTPEVQTLIQPPASSELPASQQLETTPIVPARLESVRYGSANVAVPEWVDPTVARRVQGYSDVAEWWMADAFDRAGLAPEESERRAAAAVAGGVTGAAIGALIAAPVPAVIGCLGGGAAGALIGGGVGGAMTGGAAVLPGAAAGSVIGCAAGGVGLGLVGMTIGAAIGGAAGGIAAATLAGPANLAKPSGPDPLVSFEAAAVDPVAVVESFTESVTVQVNAAAPRVESVVDQVAASSPQGEAVVTSLRGAIDQLPTFAPDQFGPLTAGLNDLTAAASAAVGAA
ncbi:hypothetical protein ACFWPX_29915 [Nocardia sp. NPDC058518]|uniref:hypothetical protein n=1 Tax=Nocardia sp. NPDC058518 TaxID=3346534 RepID=UPI00364B4EEC